MVTISTPTQVIFYESTITTKGIREEKRTKISISVILCEGQKTEICHGVYFKILNTHFQKRFQNYSEFKIGKYG